MENSEMAECLCEKSGCGCEETNSPSHIISVSVTPTTGGQFQLAVPKSDSIENLKKLISKKLKVPKERICLLYRERQLRDGTVEDNQLVDGSRLTLLPSVETGLLAQRPEQSVMQALESLNDSQVNDFLSGKAPLNLTMRLGDHMMLIQLQLSTVAPGPTSSSSSSTSSISSRPTRPVCDCASTASSQVAVGQSTGGSSTQAGSGGTTGCRCDCGGTNGGATLLDTRALAEASRNLTQTLKQLSSEEGLGRRQGAIIESMHHHGKGVYSGTFSGTLNPALQDKFGRPKRDISTIIHILNDLLCATPQYRAVQQGGAAAAQSTSAPVSSSSSSSSQQILSTSQGSRCNVPATPSSASQQGSPALISSPTPTCTTSTTLLQNNPRLNSESSVSSVGCAEESQENRATRGKMERLRLVLGQRRERRRAMRARPYASPAPPTTTAPSHTAPTPDSVTA